MNILHVDFETRSEVDLRGKESVGLYNYATHKSTRALMLAWAINDEKPSLWEVEKDERMPARLQEAVINPDIKLAAWNSQFERYIFKYCLNFNIPYHRWLDPQTSARYLSLPDDLETAGIAMSLPDEMLKDAKGEELIDIFSGPTKT